MRKLLRNFLRSYHFYKTPSEELRDEQRRYYNNRDNFVDSIQPQNNYAPETYESMFNSNMYELSDEQQENIVNHSADPILFPSQFDNSNLYPEPLNEEQIDMLTPEQEINNAIDMAAQIPDDCIVMDESNLLNDKLGLEDTINPAEAELMDDSQLLDEMLEDPMLRDDLMRNIEPMHFGPLI